MKRGNRFIVALLAAGITFATLTATVGTEHWKRGHWHHGHHGYYHHHDHDCQEEGEEGETKKENEAES